MKVPKGWLVVGKRDSKVRGDWSVIVRASAVRRALAKVDERESGGFAIHRDLPPAPTSSTAVTVEGVNAPRGATEARARPTGTVGGSSPSAAATPAPSKDRPPECDECGHPAKCHIGKGRNCVRRVQMPCEKFARPIPARGRKKGGGK